MTHVRDTLRIHWSYGPKGDSVIWRKMGCFNLTGEDDGNGNWKVASLQCSAFKVGINSSRLGGGARPLGSPYQPAGEELLELVCKHDIVILQHWPPRAFIEMLMQRGVSQVLLWADYECVPAPGYWSPLQRNIYQTLLLFRAVGLGYNRFGETYVDPYEASPGSSTDKPHCHYIALWDKAKSAGVSGKTVQAPAAFAHAVADINEKFYRGTGVGYFIDNCMERPYFGTATNAPQLVQQQIVEYQRSFQDMLGNLRKMGLGPLWGNCGAPVGIYPQLDGKFDEACFVSSAATPKAAAESAMASIEIAERLRRGLRQDYAFHVETRGAAPKWALQEGPWKSLKTEISGSPPKAHDPSEPGIYDDNIIVATARSGMYLVHPGEGVCA